MVTNPSLGSGFPGIANWPILGSIPIYELSLVLVLGIGLVYWLLVQRHKVRTQEDKAVGTPAADTNVQSVP
jgi:hypothetical protein